MSLFSFADINFKSDNRTGGPNDLLDGAANRYGYNIYRYPIDIGQADKGHYMVIHINQQRQTKFAGSVIDAAGQRPSVYENRLQTGSKPGGSFDTLVNGGLDLVNNTSKHFSDSTGKMKDVIDSMIGNAKVDVNRYATEFVRTIQRTKDTIALYMPDTVTYTHSQAYNQMSLQGDLAAAIAVGSSAVDAYKNSPAGTLNTLGAIAKNLSPFLASYISNQSNLTRAAFTAFTGVVQNPMLEIIYSSPDFRAFRFDFMFYPRSEKEATEVQDIIHKIRFHQAPEILKESNGFFLIPPSEFDIKFYYNGKENPNIPQISTCILESIDLDYAPNGFSAYEVPGEFVPKMGRTGMPVGIRMTLQFRETEFLTKANYEQESSNARKAAEFASKAWGK